MVRNFVYHRFGKKELDALKHFDFLNKSDEFRPKINQKFNGDENIPGLKEIDEKSDQVSNQVIF